MSKPKLYIASCSFGKDSLATILLSLEHNEPIDRVLFSEVMFDLKEGISGENPAHIEWVYSHAIPFLESKGLRVDVVRANKDYKDEFFAVRKSGKSKGKYAGFPMGGACVINRELKVAPIRRYLNQLKEQYDVIQYIGIAKDEPKRLERLHKSNEMKISLLEKYDYTERMAYDLCEQNGLLSPIYQSVSRGGGCWFCPNANTKSFVLFRKQFPHVWAQLKKLSMTPNLSGKFKYTESFSDVEKKMNDLEYYMDNQLSLFPI